MDLYLNELSVHDREMDHASLILLLELVSELRHFGITSCITEWNEFGMMKNAIMKLPQHRNMADLFYSFFHQPFEDYASQFMDDYVSHEWLCNGVTCIGPAVAYIAGTAVISVNIKPYDIPILSFLRDHKPVQIRNFADKSCINKHSEWLNYNRPIVIVESDLRPEDKSVSIRDDHGKDILTKFAQKLVKNRYVVSIINSLPFNAHIHRFIKQIYSDGKIEIVLNGTDAGYGLIIQTTGRNRRETETIAHILEDEFGDIV